MSSRMAREVDGLARAAERVVVGDRDRAEPDLLGVVEQVGDGRRAVVRPVRVHVQVDRDPVAAGQRVVLLVRRAIAALAGEPRVERVQLFGDAVEALTFGARALLLAEPLAEPFVAGPARGPPRPPLRGLARARPARRRTPPPRGRGAPRRRARERISPRPRAQPAAGRDAAPRGRGRASAPERGIVGRKPSGFVCRRAASQSGSSRSVLRTARVTARPPGSSSIAILGFFAAGT